MNRILICALAGLIAATGLDLSGARADALPGSPSALVASRLDAVLISRGLAGAHEVELDNPMLSLPPGVRPEDLRIASLSVDEKNGRLSADLMPAEGSAHLHVSGRVYQLIDIIVPARAIAPGEIIADRDLDHATVRLDRTMQDPLTDPAALIGKTPRHPLRPHEAVRAFDLQVPIVIHRGDLVTMTVETALMALATQGQAMEDAARGAAIRVSNTKSNRIVEGIVTGPGTVAVEIPLAP